MPSLIRFVATLGALAVLVLGIMMVLAIRPPPSPREIVVTVSPETFAKAGREPRSKLGARLAPLQSEKPGRLADVLEAVRLEH